jgi:hypothetical protein
MKRVLMCGVRLALLLGVVGCGSAGVDEGAPRGDLKPVVPIDPNMTNPGGNFGAAAAGKAAVKNAQQAKTDAANAPAPAPENK